MTTDPIAISAIFPGESTPGVVLEESWFKFQRKLWNAGLDPYQLVTLLALISHGGKNSKGIYPAYARLMEMTGQSRKRLWKSLVELRELGAISWEEGNSSKPNRYSIAKMERWNSIPQTLSTVSHGNRDSIPQTLRTVSVGNSNKKYLNQNYNKNGVEADVNVSMAGAFGAEQFREPTEAEYRKRAKEMKEALRKFDRES